MSRGKSRAAKELEGNAGQQPLKGAPADTFALPRMPRGLELAEQKVWRWTVEACQASGVPLTRADELLLVETCRVWVTVDEIVKAIRADGHQIKGARGNGKVRHPLYSVLTAQRTALKGYMAMLGLSPQTREQLSLRLPGKNGTSLDDLLK